jgi:hypothetical protein
MILLVLDRRFVSQECAAISYLQNFQFSTSGTYDHRSVRTGHPVRNHNVSIVFLDPGTRILEKKVL